MKLFFLIVIAASFFPINVVAHSGGTDSKGCHAGSQPYHCHNSKNGSSEALSISVVAWDMNVGYQYHVNQSFFIPFIGASLGKSDKNKDVILGGNFGVKLQNGWYAGYVSTSKSIQLGYNFWHVSANSEYLGLGLRFRFPWYAGSENKSSVYYSGSLLVTEDE